jgi:Na+-driven multidrug efflux pump/anti-sigma regulatory factor (Ser/Thr protein kinase)
LYERSGTLIQRKFREYLIPTVLTSIAISLGNIVNSVIVGNLLGEKALSAIGLSAPITYSLNALFLLFAVGGVTCASIAKGRREVEKANQIFTLTFVVGITSMFVLLAVLLLCMRPITVILAQGDAGLAELTLAYLTPLVFVGPVMMLIMGMAQFVRIDGKPRIAACIAITANLVNLLLAFVFIKFMNMGIAGAGLATVLGYVVGICMLLPYLLSKQRTLHFVRPRGNDFTHVPHIASVGSPKALMQGLSFLRTLVLNTLIVGALGSLGMAAMAVCVNTLMLTSMFISGTNDTLLPIVGTLYGEKDYPGIHFTVHTGFKFMIMACIAVMVLLLLIPGTVGQMFGINSKEGLAIVEPALQLYALSLPLYGVNTILQNFYQTTERVKLASLMVFLNGFGFITLFALMFTVWNVNFIWLAFLLAELATFLVILGIGVHIRKKEGTSGMLLLQKEVEDGALLDLSIPATVDAATGMSEKIIHFCRENGANESGAMRMGIAVEEMVVNTALYGHKNKQGVIDMLVRITEQELILRLRDDGVPFDPTKYQPEEGHEFAIGGIEVVRRLSKDVRYTRQLGFNVSIITIPRIVLQEN